MRTTAAWTTACNPAIDRGNTMLTARAQGYLATLFREPALPTPEVARLIEAEGVTPAQVWLDFHESYAGYWEDLGSGDVAVWGLARATEAIFCESRSVGIYRTNGAVRGIACADVHPSHGYEMKLDGQVLTPHFTAHTFDVRVERLAAWQEFSNGGGSRRVVGAERYSSEKSAEVLSTVAPGLVAEASDEHARYYISSDQVVFQAMKTGALTIYERIR